MNRDMERGAWFAFDCVLSWVNVQDRQQIDKAELYKAVMQMRPEQIARWQEPAE